MHSIRIIPRLDIKGFNVVKGIQAEGIRVVGNPKKLAYRYYQEGADELMYMDVVASLYQRSLDFDLLKSVSEGIFIPFTVGGGIRSISDINNALRAGADKVAINTFAISHPELLHEAAQKFGSQCIVLSIEAKKIRDGEWEAYTDGGREKTGVSAIEWFERALTYGIGEVIITSIDREGTRRGFEHELVDAIAKRSTVPVIAHGGAGSFETIRDVIKQCNADAVAASSIFHYKNYSIQELKNYLSENAISIRSL